MVDNGYTMLFVWPTNRLSHYSEACTRTLNNNIIGQSFGDGEMKPFD